MVVPFLRKNSGLLSAGLDINLHAKVIRKLFLFLLKSSILSMHINVASDFADRNETTNHFFLPTGGSFGYFKNNSIRKLREPI